MNLRNHSLKINITYLLAILIPIISLGSVFALFGIFPFGLKSLLIKDLYWQYIEYFNYYYDVFHSGKSLFYSWEASLGMNFFGIFGYYLSSPFSFILLLFNRSFLPEAIVAVTLIKVGFAGLAMSVFLFKGFNIKGIYNVMFAIMYALMSYVIIYSQNIMWLDGVIYLPIILLGIEFLLKKKKIGLLTGSLALMFISNFYIAYMVGIFSALYFFARIFVYYKSIKTKRHFFAAFLQFVLATLLAGGISAFITIPTYLALKETVNTAIEIPWGFALSGSLLDLSRKLYFGMYDSIKVGLPNIYSGIMPLLLFPLFFITKKIAMKEKVIFLILIGFLILSFEIPLLNLIWHAFDIPDSFPFRFSFVFSFLLLLLAARVLVIMDNEDLGWLTKIFFINVALVILLQKLSPLYMDGENTFKNLLLLTTFYSLLYGKIYFRKKVSLISVFLIILVIIDVSANGLQMLKAVDEENGYKYRGVYGKTASYQEAIESIEQLDSSFYRIESEKRYTLNDPFRFDYKGLSHFSSMANYNLFRTLHNLGYTTLEGKWVSNVGHTLVADSLIGLKYFISANPMDEFGYKKLNMDNNYHIYKNNYALPLGFMVNSKIHSMSEQLYSNPFEMQDNLLKSIGPKLGDTNYYSNVIPEKVQYNNLEVKNEGNKSIIIKKIAKQKGSIKYTFYLNGQEHIYMFINSPNTDQSKVSVNGLLLGDYPGTYSNGILDIGTFDAGKVVVELLLNSDTFVMNDIKFKVLDIERFGKLIQELRKQPFTIDKWSSRSMNGHISVNREGTLLLTIPYDKGWTINVDGDTVKPLHVAGAFIGIDLTKGDHKIEMSYISPGFKTGSIISILSLLILITILIAGAKFKKRII